MKAYRGFFRQKNSKRGMALSTAMAICIVLALLTALLVSMASLNITTTQATIGQRSGYITAKSAIAFAESYYSQHSDEIPGKAEGETGGTALFVFRDSVIAHGADIYVTGITSNPELIPAATVQDLKDGAESTYLDVVNTGSILDITAYCKYGSNDMYSLTKEFNFQHDETAKPNAFTGNITYKPTSDTRFLRIHVRASAAWGYEPYLYTYGAARNSEENPGYGEILNRSSLENKLAGDANYPDMKFSGEWKSSGTESEKGPKGAMTYEGNGWYVYEITFPANVDINYINAIVTRKGALREYGGETGATAQSWEFFGIPVPKATGEGNGADVYVTLNQSKLRDARSVGGDGSPYEWHDPITYESSNLKNKDDELTYIFEKGCGADIDSFAMFSGKWYTVYTKAANTAIMHYKYATVNDDNGSAPNDDFTYEGYGWYRDISYNFSDTLKLASDWFYYGDDNASEILSQNSYGKDVVRESFVVEGEKDGQMMAAQFPTEAQANDWIVETFGDSKAGDYVTVNVRANEMDVRHAVPTTISYISTLIKGDANVPHPDDDTNNNDNNNNDDDNKNGPEPGSVKPLSANNEEIVIEQLGKSGYKISADEYSASIENWGVAGTFNDWAKNGGDTSVYEGTTGSSERDGSTFLWRFEGLEAGTYEYYYVALTGNGAIAEQDIFDNGGTTYSFTLDSRADVVLAFDYLNGRQDRDPEITYEQTAAQYSVIGSINDWGMVEGSDAHYYNRTSSMADNGNNTFYYVTKPLAGGEQIKFKILRVLDPNGTLEDNNGWAGGNCWGDPNNKGDNQNYVYQVVGDPSAKYTVTIRFDANNQQISVTDLTEVSNILDDDFYVIGDYNNWASKNGEAQHTLAAAKKDLYKMKFISSDANSIEYALDIGQLAAGDHEVKIFSSSTGEVEGGYINYAESWGALNGAAETYGATDKGFEFHLDNYSKVTVVFKYNKNDYKRSSISVEAVNIVEGHDITGTPVNVCFYNKQLKNKNNESEQTAFVNSWSTVYYTYYSSQIGLVMDQLVTEDNMKGDNKEFCWGTVPNDADYVYFHNMPYANRGDEGYEYTDTIQNAAFRTVTNPVFFPKTATEESDGLKWSMGDNTEYRTYTLDTESKPGSADMVFSGTMQTNYYDVPMVKLLLELIPDRDSGCYAFSSVPWKKYKISGTEYHWKGEDNKLTGGVVTYQGEEYYYTKGSYDNQSFLLVRSYDSGDYRCGILRENDFAMNKIVSGNMSYGQENRAGAVFTSSSKYYNGEESKHNYGDYAPNWYTYKVPASSELTITDISGVIDENPDTYVIQGNGLSMNVAKQSSNYNYPLYIFKNNDSLQCYTYDTYIGNVDTNKKEQVSIYLNKPSSWSNNVRVHAYSVTNDDNNLEALFDYSNGDYNTFYRFEYPAGKYCFFEFYDGNDANNRTGVLGFTGKEQDREYQILCDPENALGKGGDQNSLVFYVHPKTSALYGMQDARSAKISSSFGKNYSYDGSTKRFTHSEDDEIGEFAQMLSDARSNYYKGMPDGADPDTWEREHMDDWKQASSPKWSANDAQVYTDAVYAANRFSTAISNTRIYIGSDVSDIGPGESIINDPYLFPEGAYRDDIVEYAERWVNYLKFVYDDAMTVCRHSGTWDLNTVISKMNGYADELNSIISAPEIEIGEDAAQIIVDNQVINVTEDGATKPKGGWNVSNIALYNKDNDGEWVKLGCQLYDTTQKDEGFYAYVFRVKKSDDSNVYPTNEFTIATSQPDNSVTGCTIDAGRRYTFHTATGKFEEDKSAYTIKVNTNEIDQNGSTAAYGAYPRKSDKDFVIYFTYDTTVKYKDGLLPKTYTIYAGAYTISRSSYGSHFVNDFSDPATYGINLFSENAMKFFTNKARIGLSNDVGDNPYHPWSEAFTDVTSDKDILLDSITLSEETAYAKARNAGKVNFRFKNVKGRDGDGNPVDKLTLNKNVELEAGIVTMAVNNLDLKSYDVTIKAKTVIFRTDTVIQTDHGKYTINHGTYLYNKSNDETAENVLLSMKTTGTANDWRNHYMLVDEQLSDLGGGHYIGN